MLRGYSDSAKLRTIDDLKQSIEVQREIEFYLGNQRYLLEPIYGKNGVDAVAWHMSWDRGAKEKRIDATVPDEVLNITINGIPLKKQWKKMDMINY